MYATRDGIVMYFDDGAFATSSYAAKGWVPCDAPVVPQPVPPSPAYIAAARIQAQIILDAATKLAAQDPTDTAMAAQVTAAQTTVASLVAAKAKAGASQ